MWADGVPEAVLAHADAIRGETLADELRTGLPPEEGPRTVVELDGGPVTIAIRPAAGSTVAPHGS